MASTMRSRRRATLDGAMNEPQTAGTLFRPGENCCAVAHADRAAFVVDGADYFAAFMAAAERAQRSIIVLAWDFDSRTGLAFGDDHRARTTLGEFLNDLARRRRRLQIHVLDWDYPMIFGADREFAPLYGFGWKRHRRVHFRFDDSHPLAGSHHQKIVVIDDRLAFVGGLDLTTRRWDTPDHRPAGSPASRASAGGLPPASGSGRSRWTAIRGRRRSLPTSPT
jgi:phosphatidylserine/phosphatidylglycerophosphate/cardiolipin synthase-like enzyme